MSSEKNHKKSLTEKVFCLFEKEQLELEQILRESYEMLERGDLLISKEPFSVIISKKPNLSVNQYLPEEEIMQKCWAIRECAYKKSENSIEVRFNQMCQINRNVRNRLADTLVKIWIMGEKEPIYFFLRADTQHDAMVFLGEREGQAFLIFMDQDKITHCVQLQEFYLLSVVCDEEKGKCWGILTSYSYFTGKVCSNPIQGYDLNAVVALFLSEWFRKLIEKEENGESKWGK